MEQKGHKPQVRVQSTAEFVFFSLILTAEPEISIILGLACGFECHYKDEVLFNRR